MIEVRWLLQDHPVPGAIRVSDDTWAVLQYHMGIRSGFIEKGGSPIEWFNVPVVDPRLKTRPADELKYPD